MKLLALLAIVALATGCEASPPPKPAAPEAPPLHVSPLTDLAPAAALVWLVELQPRVLFANSKLAPAIARIAPEDRLLAFAHAWGGIDLRETDELLFAAYPGTQLSLARQLVEPRRLEAAFAARVLAVDGRAIDSRAGITRLWGTAAGAREQFAILGPDCVGLEQGRFGPLRAAELFAEGKIKRASPALHAPPLAHLAELLGDAPVLAFAPGPFVGDLQRGAGGLLGASTAVGARIRVVEAQEGEPTNLAIRVVLLGAWGDESDAAAKRLLAVFDVLAASGLGKLLGLPEEARRTATGTSEALILDATVDASAFLGGLYAATAADAKEMMMGGS